jgi:hypothetical protein
MKASFYFALREIRRRPRRFFSLVAVSAAILTTLIMMLLYLEADWRSRVMPDRPENYHFFIKGLNEQEKSYIKRQPWVQAWYDINHFDNNGEFTFNEFRVRVVWEDVLRTTKRAWEVFDEFDLWSSDEYSKSYSLLYKDKLESLKREWFGIPESSRLPSGETIAEAAARAAKHELLMSSLVKNIGFCRETINTYVIRPEFLALMVLFTLFLGASMMILISERYKSMMPEFGTLRALGIKKRQIVMINCIDNLLVSIVSVPVGALAAFLIVKLYTALSAARLAVGSVYLTLLDSIPAAVIIIVSIMMSAASLLGCLAVCYINRERGTIEMIRQSYRYRVSFVAKTSRRFERARGCGIYSRLYLSRARVSILLAAAVVAVMMPLPLSYLNLGTNLLLSPDLTETARAEGNYYLFQAAILFATSASVIFISSRTQSDERCGEFGVLRALGMNKRKLRRIAFPPVIAQILLCSIPAVLLYMRITGESTSDLSLYIKKLLLEASGVMLLTAPPLIIGLMISLRRFHRRSITENIRETD